MDINSLTINKIHQGLLKKDFSSVEVTREYLGQIEKVDKSISAFLSVTPEFALAQAEKVDQLIASGKDIPALAGVPCAIKDAILVEGIRCTAGSRILENYIAPYDATVIRKMKEQGAVILGKTNLDEFAMGGSTENSAYKITRNPIDLDRVPGGSSGGSAAAVAANEACYSLGSDTGGSIRQPASFCGIVGLKPTYGSVSRYGLMAFASSLDQIGPMAKTVEDVKTIFNVISGHDSMDATSHIAKSPEIKIEEKKLRIGIPKEYFVKGMEPGVEKAVRDAVKKIEEQGIEVQEISLPHTEYALATYYIIATSEASANLARYDGIKYGLSKNQQEKLLDVYLQTRGEGFGREVKRRIMLGTYSLSSGYYDAYYLKAQAVRGLVKEDFRKAFEKIDLILAPVSPVTAFKIGERINDPLSMYLSDIFTIAVNLAGLPAISIPCGKSQGLPVGLQIIGKHFEEDKILQIASVIEKLVA